MFMAAGSVPLAQSSRLPLPVLASASPGSCTLPACSLQFSTHQLSTGVGFYPLLTEKGWKGWKGREGWFSHWRKQGFHEETYSVSVSLAHSTLSAAIVCLHAQQHKQHSLASGLFPQFADACFGPMSCHTGLGHPHFPLGDLAEVVQDALLPCSPARSQIYCSAGTTCWLAKLLRNHLPSCLLGFCTLLGLIPEST